MAERAETEPAVDVLVVEDLPQPVSQCRQRHRELGIVDDFAGLFGDVAAQAPVASAAAFGRLIVRFGDVGVELFGCGDTPGLALDQFEVIVNADDGGS